VGPISGLDAVVKRKRNPSLTLLGIEPTCLVIILTELLLLHILSVHVGNCLSLTRQRNSNLTSISILPS